VPDLPGSSRRVAMRVPRWGGARGALARSQDDTCRPVGAAFVAVVCLDDGRGQRPAPSARVSASSLRPAGRAHRAGGGLNHRAPVLERAAGPPGELVQRHCKRQRRAAGVPEQPRGTHARRPVSRSSTKCSAVCSGASTSCGRSKEAEALDPSIDAVIGVRAQFSDAAFVTRTDEPRASGAEYRGHCSRGAGVRATGAPRRPGLRSARYARSPRPHSGHAEHARLGERTTHVEWVLLWCRDVRHLHRDQPARALRPPARM
jgi:hypothetical protein